MGFFDTLLTAIAPERAVKRVAAQTAIRANQFGIFQLWRKSAQEIYAGLDVARWKPERGHRR